MTELVDRIREPRRFLQVVAGPRQVGKTTLVNSLMESVDIDSHYASADEPSLRGMGWLAQQWDIARLKMANSAKKEVVLVLDEIQKIPDRLETVKRLWVEDTRYKRAIKVIILGSAPLLDGHWKRIFIMAVIQAQPL